MNSHFTAIGASPGVAMGPAVVLESRQLVVTRRLVRPERIEAEIHRFHQTLLEARSELEEVKVKVEKKMGEKFSHLFDAHILILEDRLFADGTETMIRKDNVNAEWALRSVVRDLLDQFAAIDDPYLNERGGDLEDVYRRVLGHLTGDRSQTDLANMREDAIIVAHTLTPSDTAALNTQRVVGFVTEIGGRTSHTAILARAMGIPAVVGLEVVTNVANGGDIPYAERQCIELAEQTRAPSIRFFYQLDFKMVSPPGFRVRRRQVPEIFRLVVKYAGFPARANQQRAVVVTGQRKPGQEVGVGAESVFIIVLKTDQRCTRVHQDSLQVFRVQHSGPAVLHFSYVRRVIFPVFFAHESNPLVN